jgi:hypothetical protein
MQGYAIRDSGTLLVSLHLTMQIEYTPAMLTGVWMLFIGALGYAAGFTSLVGLTALLLVALTPAVIMTRFWGAPARTCRRPSRTCFANVTSGSVVEDEA